MCLVINPHFSAKRTCKLWNLWGFMQMSTDLSWQIITVLQPQKNETESGSKITKKISWIEDVAGSLSILKRVPTRVNYHSPAKWLNLGRHPYHYESACSQRDHVLIQHNAERRNRSIMIIMFTTARGNWSSECSKSLQRGESCYRCYTVKSKWKTL